MSAARALRRSLLRVVRTALPDRLRPPSLVAAEAVYLVRASQKRGELAAFLALVKGRRPAVLVEIGTKKGGTLYGLCRVARPDALVVSIDLPGGPFGGAEAETDTTRLRRLGQRGQRLEFIRASSHDPATRRALLELLHGRPIDVLFIDGDHTYEGVRQDYEMYGPLVAPNGVIVFHDVASTDHDPLEPPCGVPELWEELRGDAIAEFVDDAGGRWAGIGILPPTAGN